MKIDEFLHQYRESECLGETVYKEKVVKQMLKDLLELTVEEAKTKKIGNIGSYYDAAVDTESILNLLEE